jgi:nucleotide-binding universal stress UspA family protein
MYQQILVPTDGSDMSARAVETAARLANLTGAKLEVLSV